VIGWSATGSDDDARGFARRRLATYVLAVASFVTAFYVIDAIGMLSDGRAAQLLAPTRFVHLGVVVALVTAWLVVRRGERSRAALVAIEGAATLLVAGLAALTLANGGHGDIYAGPSFGIALVLVIRAAIVPCSALRTLAVGAAVGLLLVAAYAYREDASDLPTAFVAVWMSFFTAASALVSRVIYGLQKRLRAARKLGQYVLERQIGAGGMGVVYRARHSMLRRPTAVKVLLPEMTDERYLARFEREVRMTARLSHPNTITVYDFGRTPEGRFYYAMELLDGADLSEVVSIDGAQPAARVLHILTCIAGALREAHDVGLIHRDIKPSNIMLCSQGGIPDTPKLLDFGLVQDVQDDAGLSTTNAIVGTPLYLAPEAILDPHSVDARSDLYALGSVGYYLLTGDHVFTGKTAADVCRKHVDVAPVPPSERLGRDVPEILERVVLDCLAKSPGDRPADAADLQRRLRECLDIDPWDPDRARAWWTEHGDALRERRAGSERSGSDLTLDVDPAARS